MDGPWQIGHTSAAEYGRRAAEAAIAMRLVDPSIELVACGSSGSTMPTFGTWEATVLELAGDSIDHISLHAYYDPAAYETVADYLACSADLDRMIERVAAIVDADRASRPGRRRIRISVDEWNVWHLTEHREREAARAVSGFERAPALAEDTHDLADALVVGCLLITILRHADRVAIACLAQLVNVIPAIRTIDGGPAWLQASAYPFADVARCGRGTVLELEIDATPRGVIEATAVHDPAKGGVTVFAVNRADEDIRLDALLRGFDRLVDRRAVGTDRPRPCGAQHRGRSVPDRAAPGQRRHHRRGAAGGSAPSPLLERRPARTRLTIRRSAAGCAPTASDGAASSSGAVAGPTGFGEVAPKARCGPAVASPDPYVVPGRSSIASTSPSNRSSPSLTMRSACHDPIAEVAARGVLEDQLVAAVGQDLALDDDLALVRLRRTRRCAASSRRATRARRAPRRAPSPSDTRRP